MAKLLRNDPTFTGSINDLGYPVDDHYNTDCNVSTARFMAATNHYRSDLQEIFTGRLHSLMGYKSSTVEDALY